MAFYYETSAKTGNNIDLVIPYNYSRYLLNVLSKYFSSLLLNQDLRMK